MTTEHTTFNEGDHVQYVGCFTDRTGVLLTSAPDDAPDTTVLVNWDNGGQESVKIGALRNVTPVAVSPDRDADGFPTLPKTIGSDQESPEGITRSLVVSDYATGERPRVAIDLADNSGVRPDSSELGWFDVRTMIRNLAEFAPDLVVVRREDLPEVTITQDVTGPTTCIVDIGGVRRFSGADWTGHAVNAQYLHDQLTETRMKLATAEGTIEHQRGRIQTLTDACQRKNSDCARYAEERRAAIEARKTAEDEAGDLRARWAAYATALARLKNNTTPQVIGTNIVMRHETYVEIEREIESLRDTWVTASTYDRERKDHDATRAELRTMTTIARKWQRFAAVLELMGDGTDVELTIDGVRIQVAKP